MLSLSKIRADTGIYWFEFSILPTYPKVKADSVNSCPNIKPFFPMTSIRKNGLTKQ